MGKCRSCGAPVFWAYTDANMKRMPVDSEPRPDGNIVLLETPEGMFVSYVGAPEQEQLFETERYVSHFATCPDSRKWRKV